MLRELLHHELYFRAYRARVPRGKEEYVVHIAVFVCLQTVMGSAGLHDQAAADPDWPPGPKPFQQRPVPRQPQRGGL